MGWLGTILSWLGSSWLGRLALDYIWGKITTWFEVLRRQREIDEKTKAEAEAIDKAQTEEEREKATDNILSPKRK
jgi:hypothetical protein